MSLPVLEIIHLSKKFRLHHEGNRNQTFRESLVSIFKSSAKLDEDFWVLNDLNFKVDIGSSLGIIGRNGAGKSTLLKILSRISPPTSGKIKCRGRIASLLEVGTGFHSELTGRENIFMNGSLLGMKRKEILSSFDEIVDFSGVERFLDTPLKHYSSGMQLRLAFSVAAHLKPEVLVIDEVLAVGDAGFQRKCLGKMEEVSREGRTVLFVSHNFSAVQSLCKSCLYLSGGRIVASGSPQEVIAQYMQDITQVSNEGLKHNVGDEIASLRSVRLIDLKGNPVHWIDFNDAFQVEVTYEILKDGFCPTPNVHISNVQSEKVMVAIMPKDLVPVSKGVHIVRVIIPANLLNPNSYVFGFALTSFETMKVHFYDQESQLITIEEDISKRPHDYRQVIPGVIRPNLEWC